MKGWTGFLALIMSDKLVRTIIHSTQEQMLIVSLNDITHKHIELETCQ